MAVTVATPRDIKLNGTCRLSVRISMRGTSFESPDCLRPWIQEITMHIQMLSAVAALSLLALAMAAPARAADVAVTNCNDDGSGSLRAAVASAANGDVVDLRELSCNRITLTSGAIVFGQADLTILGPGWKKFAVSGNRLSSIFRQEPTQPPPDPGFPRVDGTLRLQGFTIAWGREEADLAAGGCIFANSRVVLDHMHVHHCVAKGTDPVFPSASGGGVFAWNDVTLIASLVDCNRANPSGTGGGVETHGKLTLDHSRVSHNVADANGGGSASTMGLSLSYSTVDHNTTALGNAGGVATAGAAWINKSTIAYNDADFRGAGEFDNTQPTRIIESTISHNTANRSEAGIQLDGRYLPTEVRNSTIAFNAATNPFFGSCSEGAGIALAGPVKVVSSIVSGNTCAGQPSNIGQEAGNPPAQVIGSQNLIGASFVPLPADTLMLDDPRLAPLANNGGPTMTHALLSDSLAIDRGSNPSNFKYDQRGPGFPRVKGTQADIGAFER